ncbi:hypothetical protein JCM10908_001045 [Rhodotorula pacifica]|uniref:uncharacterized protein n=1 Tax=Rhodotorula pacifica TaxID=1495444 RepID=UPI0031735D8A
MASGQGRSPSDDSARASTSQEPFLGDADESGTLPDLIRTEQHRQAADGGEAQGEAGSSNGSAPRKKGNGAKRSANGPAKLDKYGNPKKKRKQLVACDSCRLRRVKCDKAEMKGGPCSECVKKTITCTDTYVKNKPKIVRGGKLISQAKKMYGEGVDLDGNPVPDFEDGAGSETYLPAPREQSAFSFQPQARQQLVMNQLTPDVSDHLVRIFFDVFQPQCPLVDETYFMQAWQAAGRDSANLTPALECLALAMQAWAARFTDHVSVIGSNGPTLAELRNGAGRDFTMIGKLREGFAKGVLQRAIETVDRRAGLRTASTACCSALVLLEFLVTWDDVARKSNAGRYLLSSACEHLRNLQLGECDDPTEPPIPPERASNGTLLWMVYTRDALGAMLGGRSCALSDDDLNSLSDLFNSPITADVISYVSSSDPRMLSGLAVASIFRYCVTSVRNTVARLTGPLARRQRLSAQAVHEIWSEIDESARYGSIFRQSVERATFGPDAPKTDVWFRDLTAMKSQHTLGIHLALSARLREEESKQQDADPEYLNTLRRLKQQSDDRLFRVSREYCHILHAYGGNLVFAATVTPEYSAHYLEALVDTPAWEQGGPGDWTWAVKNEEVARCIEVIQLAGWCWPGYDIVIERARRAINEQHILLTNQQAISQAQQQQQPERARSSYGNGESAYQQHEWSRTSQDNLPQPDYSSYQLEPPRQYSSGDARQPPSFSSANMPAEGMHLGPGPLHPLHGQHGQGSPPSPPFPHNTHSLAPLRAPPQQQNPYHNNGRPGEMESQHMRLPSLSDYRNSPTGSSATRMSLPSLSGYAHPSAPPPPPQ